MHTVVSHLIQRVCDDESVLCSCRPLWERSPLFWDLFRALSFRAAACRDCSWGIWCACYWFRLWMGLRVWLAGNYSLRSRCEYRTGSDFSRVHLFFKIRSFVFRSNTSGFYSLFLNCQSEKSDQTPPTQRNNSKRGGRRQGRLRGSAFKVCFHSSTTPLAALLTFTAKSNFLTVSSRDFHTSLWRSSMSVWAFMLATTNLHFNFKRIRLLVFTGFPTVFYCRSRSPTQRPPLVMCSAAISLNTFGIV